jgi:hypothetical protein
MQRSELRRNTDCNLHRLLMIYMLLCKCRYMIINETNCVHNWIKHLSLTFCKSLFPVAVLPPPTFELGTLNLLALFYTMADSRGALIVIEGLDRSGKTTQSARLVARLEEAGHNVNLIKFPGQSLVTMFPTLLVHFLCNYCHSSRSYNTYWKDDRFISTLTI